MKNFVDFAVAAFVVGFFLVLLQGCESEVTERPSPSLAWAGGTGYDRLIIADRVAEVPVDATVVVCGTACDDNNPCTIDTCDTTSGKCTNISKSWDCWPCQSDEDCSLGMVTCQGDGLIHEDGYSICQQDKTCETFHKTSSCDDGNPCTVDACTTEDDFVFCENKSIPGCKP